MQKTQGTQTSDDLLLRGYQKEVHLNRPQSHLGFKRLAARTSGA